MRRKASILSATGLPLTLVLVLPACTTTGPSDTSSQQTNKHQSIDAGVDSTVARLYDDASGSRELVSKAKGVLIFPSVIDASFVIGGQYGERSLRVNRHTVGYYSTATGSVGWPIDTQSRAIIFLFMTDESRRRFRSTDRRSAGGDASAAVLKVGANRNVETRTATGQVGAFVLTNAGPMAGASLEGTKVTRLNSL